MKSRYASPLLPQAEALLQRASGADNFIDLTGDECVGDVTGENNFVDLTGLENVSDPAVLTVYYTESVESPPIMKTVNDDTLQLTGSLPPRTPRADNFVDLILADNVTDWIGADNDVDLTGSVRYIHKGKEERIISSNGDTTNSIMCRDDTATAEAAQNNHSGSIHIMDQIIFKLDRMNAYMAFTSYTLFIASAKEYNATAYIPTSHLDVPPHIIPPPGLTVHQAIVANVMSGLPAYPDPNLEVPPLPRTLKGIMKLTKANLIAVENYYGLSHDGNVADRRDRIKQSYGVTVGARSVKK